MRRTELISASRWRLSWRLILGVISLMAGTIAAVPAAKAGYEMGWFSATGTGGRLSGGAYTLNATAGQAAAGRLTGSPYSLFAGFLAATQGIYTTVGVEDGGPADLPAFLQLHQVTPDPMTNQAIVRFDLPKGGPIRLHIYDVAGRLRRTLVDENLPAGRYQRSWNATGDDGRRIGPGIYFVLMEAQSARLRQRVVVIR